MADTSYEYDLLNDFPHDAVDGECLEYEVNHSAISSAACLHIETGWSGEPLREKCKVWFDGALSSEDKTVLDDIVASHTATPLSYESFSSSPEKQSTTSLEFQTKILMETIDLPEGNYIVYGEAVFGGTDTDTEFEGRIVFCGNEVTRVRQRADVEDSVASIHAERKIENMAGVRTVEIQWRRVSGTGSATVESAYAWVREQ